MLDERSVQTVSTPFTIFKNKVNVASMLNESFIQFKFDSKHFQQALNTFLRFQQCRTTCLNAFDIWFNNCVEGMLKLMLKPFKRALTPFVMDQSFIFIENPVLRTCFVLVGSKPVVRKRRFLLLNPCTFASR